MVDIETWLGIKHMEQHTANINYILFSKNNIYYILQFTTLY